MTTDELREKYTGKIHFNCKDGDEAFTDGYVLWLEEQLISYHKVQNLSNGSQLQKTPKQEANELISLFYGVVDKEIDSGQLVPKTCALVVVNKLIKYLPSIKHFITDNAKIDEYCYEYWVEVKEEILKG